MEEKTIEKMIDELKESPLYAMSLGGRELYHSNFWAWLMEYGEKNKNKAEGNPFFKIFFGKEYYTSEYYSKTPKIDREKGHRDLTITFDDKYVFVIENKLKSIATLNQLYRYKNSVEYNLDKNGNIKSKKITKKGEKIEFVHGVLTGISPDIDLPENCGWSFLSYEDICKELNKICENTDNSKDNDIKIILKKYIKDTKIISQIITKVVPEEINTWDMQKIDDLSNDDNNTHKLSDIRMDDLCKKKWANMFAQRLEEKLKEELDLHNTFLFEGKEYKLQRPISGFTDKKPLVEVFYRAVDDKNNKHDLIGIQIQGNQYRRCFSRSEDTTKTALDERYESLQSLGWFGKHNNTTTISWGGKQYETSQRKDSDYCKYKPSFIYQHIKLQGDCLKFDNLLKAIKNDIKFASQILQDLQNRK